MGTQESSAFPDNRPPCTGVGSSNNNMENGPYNYLLLNLWYNYMPRTYLSQWEKGVKQSELVERLKKEFPRVHKLVIKDLDKSL